MSSSGGGAQRAERRFPRPPKVDADRNSAPDRTSRSDDFKEIDAYIERQMQRLNMPGVALAIVEGDKIVREAAISHRSVGCRIGLS